MFRTCSVSLEQTDEIVHNLQREYLDLKEWMDHISSGIHVEQEVLHY